MKAASLLLAALAMTVSIAVAQPWRFDGELATYQRIENGHHRVFDFDGPTPFVNPRSGVSDIAYMDFAGTGLSSAQITNAGSGTGHISKVIDPLIGSQVTRVRLLPTDSGPGGYRTQIDGHHIEPYRTYLYVLEFRLDEDWNFGMRPGSGLIWQVKGNPKAGQWGNPSLALNLEGNRLALTILYPRAAMAAASWPVPVRWGNGEYVDAALAPQTVVAGRYHRIEILFVADERPPAFGGRGRLQAWFDGESWAQYEGPTLHPDQNGPHRIDFGWYQWEGRPSAVRTVYFKTSHLYVLKQLNGDIP